MEDTQKHYETKHILSKEGDVKVKIRGEQPFQDTESYIARKCQDKYSSSAN